FQRGFDVRLQFVERLADRTFQLGLCGLEPCVGDLREHAGLASSPRIAHGFPAALARSARGVAIELHAQVGKAQGYLLGRSRVERRKNFSSRNWIRVHWARI